MKKPWQVVVFLILCIAIGVIAGISLGFFFNANTLFARTKQEKQAPSQAASITPQPSAPTAQTATPSVAPSVMPISTPATATANVATAQVTTPSTPTPRPTLSSCPQPKDPSQPDLWLKPVGPNVYIGNYVPTDLVLLSNYVPTTKKDICLTQSATDALVLMFKAMHNDNLYPVVTSAFRDVNYQEHLYEGTNTLTNGYSSVALPGHSEHQLGVTVDLVGVSDPTNTNYFALDEFGKTADYAWLVNHAADYGFVQSYQVGEESITGYIPEPWHWRYVGITNAQAIVASKLPSIEYLQKLEDEATNPNPEGSEPTGQGSS